MAIEFSGRDPTMSCFSKKGALIPNFCYPNSEGGDLLMYRNRIFTSSGSCSKGVLEALSVRYIEPD